MPTYTLLSINPARDPIVIESVDPVAALMAIENNQLGVIDLLEDGHYVFSCDATLKSDWKIFRRLWL